MVVETPGNERAVYSRRLALQVERYHTWPKITRQSVGEHSAQVMRIYLAIFGELPSHVAVHVLEHDMPEMRIGDLPFSGEFAPELKAAKAAVEERVRPRMGIEDRGLSPRELDAVKICDLMDCFEWGLHEARLGNAYGRTVVDNVRNPILSLARKSGWEIEDAVRSHMVKLEMNW